jgi:hypothetical protein
MNQDSRRHDLLVVGADGPAAVVGRSSRAEQPRTQEAQREQADPGQHDEGSDDHLRRRCCSATAQAVQRQQAQHQAPREAAADHAGEQRQRRDALAA